MISIYQAANLADAHLIRHLLEQERIDCYIAGEYLQGALGEIPANTPVDVRVAPEDATRARKIVEEWENSEPDPAMFEDEAEPENAAALCDTKNATGHRIFSTIMGWIGGTAIGAGLMWAAHNGPRDQAGIDYDNDGVLEARAFYVGERIARYETDRNRDRKPDLIQHYDRHGNIERDEVDNDFDGRFEERGEYAKGLPMLYKTDRDHDGATDYRVEFLRGVRFREEWLDANGNIAKRIDYRD